MPLLPVRDVEYYYEMQGGGRPLLLLHGFTGCTENWAHCIPPLSAHFRAITIDLLGHGQSSKPDDPTRYRMENAAADLIAFLDQVVQKPIDLLGYSMGGRLALYLALHHPQHVRRLILESASPGLITPEERAARQTSDEQLADRIEREGIPAFVDYWEALPLFATQEKLPIQVQQRLRLQRLRNDRQGLANSLRGMGTGVQPSLWDDLSDCQVPTDLIVGEKDTKFLTIAQQMQQCFHQCTLHIVPGAGHTVHLEQPAQFVEIVI